MQYPNIPKISSLDDLRDLYKAGHLASPNVAMGAIMSGLDYIIDVVNITGYGAVGDGTTDDTNAIQAAIDALPGDTTLPSSNSNSAYAPGKGGIVFFPAGQYLISSPIILNKQAYLVGAGWTATEIILKASSNCDMVVISGVPRPQTYQGLWSVATTYSLGDVVYYAIDSKVYIYINSTPSAGSLPTNMTYWQYKNNIGLTGAGISNMFIHGNSATGAHDIIRIENAWDVNLDYVLLEFGQQHGVAFYYGCWHSHIQSCAIEFFTGDGIYVATPTTYIGAEGDFLSIAQSVIWSARNGINLTQTSAGKIQQCEIYGNYLSHIAQNAILLDGALSCSFSSNMILSPSQIVPQTYSAILLTGDATYPSTDNIITGNIIQGSNHKYGIHIDDVNCNNNIVLGNRLNGVHGIVDVGTNLVDHNQST